MSGPVSPFDLSGRTALVTGANTGLGQAIAVGLAEPGVGAGDESRTAAEVERVHFNWQMSRTCMSV